MTNLIFKNVKLTSNFLVFASFFLAAFFVNTPANAQYNEHKFEQMRLINGKSFYLDWTRLLVHQNGTIEADMQFRSNRLEGFHGAVKFAFRNAKGQIIHEISAGRYGVNGKRTRHANFKGRIPANVAKNYKTVTLFAHTQSNSTSKNVNNLKQIGRDIGDIFGW